MVLKINKDNWEKVRLIDVLTKKEENDRENAHHRFDRFLKVEHMDAESLHIKRWASQENGDEINPTFYKIFRKGQILFPTRNPHLRRTVLASFDGICGEKTLTLESNEEFLVSKFIPFLFHSDSFYNHTTGAIVGSTNPHVRWRDVADYEFLLPPKDQQAQLADLLWSMDGVIEREKYLSNNLKTNLDLLIENEIHGIDISGKTIKMVIEELSIKTKVVTLNSLGVFLKGKGIAKSDVVDSGIPCVRYGELYTKHHRVIRKYYSFIDRATADQGFRLERNDIMFAGSGETINEIGKSASFVDDLEVYAGSDTIVFRPKEMNGFYLGYLMNSQLVRKQLNKLGTGATVMHIYQSDIKKIKVPLINIENQKAIASKLEQFTSNIELVDLKIKSSQSLQKSIINQIF